MCFFFYRSEKGVYYALDLGGTNFRVLRVQLGGKQSILRHEVERQPIPQALITGNSEVIDPLFIQYFFVPLGLLPM